MSAVRAVVFTDPETLIELVEVDLAPPGPGEVRVRVAAAGVCHSDLHVARGEWSPAAPLVMGHEGSGVVTQTGRDVASLAVGDHVVFSWVPACGVCRHCRAGRESRCVTVAEVVAPLGVLLDGTSRLSIHGRPLHHYLGVSSFADEVVVPESGAVRISREAPLEVAAVVGCAVATGVGAVMNTAAVIPGSSVAVIGCGGVGLNVVQGARLAGAERIIAIDVRDDKTLTAIAFGATDRISARDRDAAEMVRELVPEGVDYAFDAIGHPATTEAAIRMLALGGAAVIVGLAREGATVAFAPLTLAESDQRILGSNYGSSRPGRDIPALIDCYLAGDLLLEPLITDRRPLNGAAPALEALSRGEGLRTLLLPDL